MKSRLVFLDANVIIEAHRLKIWNHLVAQFDIFIPSFILDNEVKYFTSSKGQTVVIDLATDEKNGKVKRDTALPSDFQKLYANFKPLFVDGLDPGEKEALALLYSGRYEDFRFCTGDGAAIRALSILSLQFQGVSFETLMNESGQKAKDFKRHFQEEFFKKNITQGSTERDSLKK